LRPVVSTTRKLTLLRSVIDEADTAAATHETTDAWVRAVAAVLRTTMGASHPFVAALEKVHFSPLLITWDMPASDWDEPRAAGVRQVVELLEEAIAEVEMADGGEDVAEVSATTRGPIIFLVHGHDGARKYEVARYLQQATGEWPLILHEQPDRSRTIIEKLEDHGSQAGFAVILLTGDDEGREKGAADLTARARQNVVFEHGYFIGKLELWSINSQRSRTKCRGPATTATAA
jgi:hypothetical protein